MEKEMSNVIGFREKALEIEPVVWKCDCGNCSFLIYADGLLECAECTEIQNGCDAHYQAIRKWVSKDK